MDLYENLLLASLLFWGIAGGVVTASALGLISPLALLLPPIGMLLTVRWLWMTWEPRYFESVDVVSTPESTELVVALQRQSVELVVVFGGWMLAAPLLPIGARLLRLAFPIPAMVVLFVAQLAVLISVILLSLRQDRLRFSTRLLIDNQSRVLIPGMAGTTLGTPTVDIIRHGEPLSLSDVIGVSVVPGGLCVETIDGACDLPIPEAPAPLLSSLAAALREHATPLGAFAPQAAEDRAAMQAALAKVRPVESA